MNACFSPKKKKKKEKTQHKKKRKTTWKHKTEQNSKHCDYSAN